MALIVPFPAMALFVITVGLGDLVFISLHYRTTGKSLALLFNIALMNYNPTRDAWLLLEKDG